MLTAKERKELETLEKCKEVQLARKQQRAKVDKEKQRLYQLRWLKKKGEELAKARA